MSALRILIVDDHEVVRRGLRALLASRWDWEVCGEAADGEEAVERAKTLRPDVVLMDISMPRMNGLDATRIIRRELPECKVVIVSMNDSETASSHAREVNAAAYVAKSETPQTLLSTIEKVVGQNGGERLKKSTASGPASLRESDERGGPERLIGVNIDVTERKRTESTLRENERRYREMIDALPAAIYTTDAEGRLTHFNPAAVKFSGRTPELGTDQWCVTWKLFRSDGTPLPHDECPMAVALKEGRIVDGVETIAERPDGTRVWFTPYPRPLHDAAGRIVGGINMLVDITERKRAEQASGLLGAIVDSSDDAIVSKNLDGVITSWNKSAERLFGYSAEEAVGRHITLIIPPDRRNEETMILDRLRRGERVDHFETVRLRKDGRSLEISVTISPVRDATGRVVGASKVARDVSERKRAERALQDSENRLRAVTDALETQVRARTEELEQRNQEVLMQSEQLRELSHGLMQIQDNERRHIARELHDSAGQMLAALGMNLSSLVREAKEKAPQLAKEAEEAQELVRELSREIRTTSYLLHPPLLDESGLMEALLWYIPGLKERSGLDIELAIPKDFGRLSSEMELVIFRVVQECLTNVHRHSGSKVAAIRIARNGHGISLEVQDEGQGISPEKLAEIQSRGAGVGLRGMRERVRQLGGELRIESEGRGTRISVTLPVAESGRSKTAESSREVRVAR